MKVLMVEPGFAPYEKELNGLHAMQAAVGGLIEAVHPFQDKAVLVCNEEGAINGMPFNRSIPGRGDGIFGPFFICSEDGEEFCSLTQAQIEKYKNEFYYAEELLFVIGNTVFTDKVKPKTKHEHPAKMKRHEKEGNER